MQNTIKLLPESELRIIKEVRIVSERNDNDFHLASIVYKRKFSSSYNLKKQQEEDERTNATLLNKLLSEHPKQVNYPMDDIDTLIFESIQSYFPKSYVRNDLILFNVDLEKIEYIKRRMAKPSKVILTPSFHSYEEMRQMVGASFEMPIVPLNIFSYYNDAKLENVNFHGRYYFRETDIITRIQEVEFE